MTAAMGCADCADASIQGTEVQPICIAATTQAECLAASPGGEATFRSGSIPPHHTTQGAGQPPETPETSSRGLPQMHGAGVQLAVAVVGATVLHS